jgi:hypothetical protein
MNRYMILAGILCFAVARSAAGSAAGGSAVENNARRSSIQVVELKYSEKDGSLTADRDAPTMINPRPPVDLETESESG